MGKISVRNPPKAEWRLIKTIKRSLNIRKMAITVIIQCGAAIAGMSIKPKDQDFGAESAIRVRSGEYERSSLWIARHS